MSETLRDLVVSLSLNSDNFTRNIKSITKQLQEVQADFRLASAGIDGFENTTAGLASKLSMLQKQFSLQTSSLSQYQGALAQASAKLTECYNRQNEYTQRLAQAKQAHESLGSTLSAATQEYERLSRTMGEGAQETQDAKAVMESLQKAYEDSAENVKKLEGQVVALDKATQNAADNFSKTNTQLKTAEAAVRDTGSEIIKTQTQLTMFSAGWKEAGDSIKASEQNITSIGLKMKTAESEYLLASIGVKDFAQSVEGTAAKTKLLTTQLSLQRDKVRELEGQLKSAKIQLEAAQSANDPEKIRLAKDQLEQVTASLNIAKAAMKQLTGELEIQKSKWAQAGAALKEFSGKCKDIGMTMQSIGRSMTMYLTTPLLTLGAAAIKSGMSFESAFTSVRKTVDATEEEYAQLSDGIKQMSTEVAASADSIAEVMAIAGQLGIKNDALMEFTRTMIDLSNSTNISATEGASNMARFANIMGMSQNEFRNMGSTLVDLGNNFATTESEILEMSMRLAGAGKQVGLTEAQVLGFATGLSSVGIQAQMGGSAFSKALVKMEVASETGGQALTDFANVCGLTEEQFKTLWDSNPAEAFMAFITGLSKMDEEGISAIKTLDDMGISEIRLRDTLLRSTNATDLFTRALSMADNAWGENTALTEEANKRYATTESQLVNLKNKAVLFGQTLGADLKPTIEKIIISVSDLLDKLLAMDSAERMQLMKTALIIAGIGPVTNVLGKVTTGVGNVTGVIGKLCDKISDEKGLLAKTGQASGTFAALGSIISKSPVAWIALGAAIIGVTVAIIDVVTGAKAARDAIKDMNDTAMDWRSTAADTFYNREGLSFFGMSKDSFVAEKENMKSWLAGVISVWSDGQLETDDIVAHWTDSFKTLTDKTRQSLVEMKSDADASGLFSVSASLAADIKRLDEIDAEVDALLKKRQNGFLTDKEKIRLEDLIDTRESIIVRYHLEEDAPDGFAEIERKLEAERARARATGKSDVDVSVYESAVKAAAEGFAAATVEIDKQYDKEYALIQLMEDGSEKTRKQNELDAKYNRERNEAAREYAELLSRTVMPVWDQTDIATQAYDIDRLCEAMTRYNIAASNNDTWGMARALEEMNEITKDMDESALTEYLMLLSQMQDLMSYGVSEEDLQRLFPDISIGFELSQFSDLASFVKAHPGDLEGLGKMFSVAIPEEMLKISASLDMENINKNWSEFADSPKVITATVNYETGETVNNGQSGSLGLTGYDLKYYNQFAQTHNVQTVQRVGATGYTSAEQILGIPGVKVYENGVEIPITPAVAEKITQDSLFITDKDGSVHVMVTPEVKGTQESVAAARTGVEMKQAPSFYDFMQSLFNPSIMDRIEEANEKLTRLAEIRKSWPAIFTKIPELFNIENLKSFSGENLESLTIYVQEVVTAIKKGEEVSQEDLDNLQAITDFLNNLDMTGTGENVRAGIAQGMTEAGWDSDASTVAANLQTAVNDALGIESPSKVMMPTGEYVAEGIGVGMTDHDWTTELSAFVNGLVSALQSALSSEEMKLLLDNISASFTQGLSDSFGLFDFTPSTTAMADNIVLAVTTALPGTSLAETGQQAMQGLADSLVQFDVGSVGTDVAAKVENSISTGLTSATLKNVGYNAMLGLKQGIIEGKLEVVTAMQEAAFEAVKAAKEELKIKSPSRVFRDEVGVMTMRGFGEGVRMESTNQAKVIRNAARYLTKEAQGGVYSVNNSDNSRVYNQDSTVSFAGSNFYINDKQDAYSLAVEISALTRRQQRGKGMRNA